MTSLSLLSNAPDADQERRNRGAWDRLVRRGELAPNVVRGLVEDSWRRCYQAGVDPHRVIASVPTRIPDPSRSQQGDRDLVEASIPIMAQTGELLAESGTMMVLADANGVIRKTEGDRATIEAATEVRLMAGADWSEFSRGTNGIGTALSAGGPVQIHASEHFCAGIQLWSCSATVVRDSAGGTVLGALSVCGLSTAFSHHILALVVAAAGRIEATMAGQELKRRERLLEYGLLHKPSNGSAGLILFDRRGRLLQADARAGLTLAALGVELGPRPGLRIEALDVSGPLDSGKPALPEWLRPEWINPVADGDEQLGTLVALPEHFRRSALLPEAGLPAYKLRRVLEFIEAHLDQSIQLEELAAVVAVSPFHFHRKFKRSTGVTPHQYIIETRIERAKALLSESELPLIDVAAKVGYADQSHFTNTFRRKTSMTPRAYRYAMSV